MLPADNTTAAHAAEQDIQDERIRFWFDADQAAADAWSSFMGMSVTTWDVYAIYDGAASWSDAGARIWMHQLDESPATRSADRLDPHRLARAWLELIGGDAEDADALAETLDAGGSALGTKLP